MLRLIKKDGEGEIISHLPEIEAGEFENFLIDNGQPTTVNCISLTLLMVSNQYTVNRNDQMKQMQDAFSQMFEAQAKLMLEIKQEMKQELVQIKSESREEKAELEEKLGKMNQKLVKMETEANEERTELEEMLSHQVEKFKEIEEQLDKKDVDHRNRENDLQQQLSRIDVANQRSQNEVQELQNQLKEQQTKIQRQETEKQKLRDEFERRLSLQHQEIVSLQDARDKAMVKFEEIEQLDRKNSMNLNLNMEDSMTWNKVRDIIAEVNASDQVSLVESRSTIPKMDRRPSYRGRSGTGKLVKGMSKIMPRSEDIDRLLLEPENPDMAYLYADPLVKTNKQGNLTEYLVPLDLETEYGQIVRSLEATGKQFSILKEAMNMDSLETIIGKSPSMMHISCHGHYQEETKQFYLSIESNKEVGKESELTQEKLRTILKTKKAQETQIKLAFVSACHSEEIGNIFLDAGIPIVISVSADQEIMDDAAKEFGKNLYKQLLTGESIKQSFEQAKDRVRSELDPLKDNFSSCCCAHKHDDDCVWYQYYLKDPVAAHALHDVKNCACYKNQNNKNGNGRIIHEATCKSLMEFQHFMYTKRCEQQKEIQKNSGGSSQAKAAGGLAALMADDSDADSIEEMEDEIELVDNPCQRIASGNAKPEDLIICCCKKDMPHDETMKFQVKFHDDKAKELYKQPLFIKREDGELYQFSNQDDEFFQIKIQADKRLLYGRHCTIHEIIQFLVQSTNKRILCVNGEQGAGCSSLANFAVNYIRDRDHFEDGAIYIDAKSNVSSQSLVKKISKSLKLYEKDIDSLCSALRTSKMVLVIDECSKVLNKDIDKLTEDFKHLMSTNKLKIILIPNKTNKFQLDMEGLMPVIQEMKVESLKADDSAKIIHHICKDKPRFLSQFNTPEKLKDHELLKTFKFTMKDLEKICYLIEKNETIDQIQNLWMEKSQNEGAGYEEEQDKKDDIFISKIVAILREKHKDAINIIRLLSFAPFGLMLDDIFRIIDLSEEEPDQSKLCFGDWMNFLKQEIMDEAKAEGNNKYEMIKVEQSEINQNRSINLKISLDQSLIDFIQADKTFKYTERVQLSLLYLRYMAILSRQIMLNWKESQLIDFDPFLLTTMIDQGFWAQPEQLKYRLTGERDEDEAECSKKFNIDQPEAYFQYHEGNINELVDRYDDLFDCILNSSKFQVHKKELNMLTEELFSNLTTIQIMLKRERDAQLMFENGKLIADKFDNEMLKVKTILIDGSVKQKNVTVSELQEVLDAAIEAADLFEDMNNQTITSDDEEGIAKSNGLAESFFLQALYHMSYLRSHLKSKQEQEMDLSRSDSSATWNTVISGISNVEQMNEQHRSEEIRKHFVEAWNLLDKTANSFECQLGKAKTLLVQVDWLYNVALQIPQLKPLFRDPNERLIISKVTEDLSKNHESFGYNDSLSLQSKFYIAQSYYKIQNYVDSREWVLQCLRLARSLENQDELFHKSYELYQNLNKKDTGIINNLFIFAKSSPVNLQKQKRDSKILTKMKESQKEFVIQKQIMDDNQLFSMLNGAGKSIDVQFEVFNKKLIEEVRDNGCRILHLTPKIFTLQRNQTFILVENEKLEPELMDIPEFKKLLTPRSGKLQVQLVILEQINCKALSQAFLDMGVSHVVSLILKPNRTKTGMSRGATFGLDFADKTLTDDQNAYLRHQRDILLTVNYMKIFWLQFYLFLINDEQSKMTEVCSMAKKETDEAFKLEEFGLELEVYHHTLKNKVKDQILFDTKSKKDNKALRPGEIVDCSQLRAQSNVAFDQNQHPFVVRKSNQFHELIQHLLNFQKNYQLGEVLSESDGELTSPKAADTNDLQKNIHHVNVFGEKGSGKTRIVMEVVRYMRYRYHYQQGIYRINLDGISEVEEIEIVLERIRAKKKVANQSKSEKTSNDKLSTQHTLKRTVSNITSRKTIPSEKQRPADLLLVLDNCDEVLKKSKNYFDMNLEAIKRSMKGTVLQFILISVDQIESSKKNNLKHYKINSFSRYESYLYMQTINFVSDKINLEENRKKLSKNFDLMFRKSTGNAQIMKILNQIYWIGNEGKAGFLLNRVDIQPEKKQNSAEDSKLGRNDRSGSIVGNPILAALQSSILNMASKEKEIQSAADAVSVASRFSKNVNNQRARAVTAKKKGSGASLLNAFKKGLVAKFTETETPQRKQSIRKPGLNQQMRMMSIRNIQAEQNIKHLVQGHGTKETSKMLRRGTTNKMSGSFLVPKSQLITQNQNFQRKMSIQKQLGTRLGHMQQDRHDHGHAHSHSHAHEPIAHRKGPQRMESSDTLVSRKHVPISVEDSEVASDGEISPQGPISIMNRMASHELPSLLTPIEERSRKTSETSESLFPDDNKPPKLGIRRSSTYSAKCKGSKNLLSEKGEVLSRIADKLEDVDEESEGISSQDLSQVDDCEHHIEEQVAPTGKDERFVEAGEQLHLDFRGFRIQVFGDDGKQLLIQQNKLNKEVENDDEEQIFEDDLQELKIYKPKPFIKKTDTVLTAPQGSPRSSKAANLMFEKLSEGIRRLSNRNKGSNATPNKRHGSIDNINFSNSLAKVQDTATLQSDGQAYEEMTTEQEWETVKQIIITIPKNLYDRIEQARSELTQDYKPIETKKTVKFAHVEVEDDEKFTNLERRSDAEESSFSSDKSCESVNKDFYGMRSETMDGQGNVSVDSGSEEWNCNDIYVSNQDMINERLRKVDRKFGGKERAKFRKSMTRHAIEEVEPEQETTSPSGQVLYERHDKDQLVMKKEKSNQYEEINNDNRRITIGSPGFNRQRTDSLVKNTQNLRRLQTRTDGAIIDDEMSYGSELEPDQKPNLQVIDEDSSSENEDSDFQSDTFGSELSRKEAEQKEEKERQRKLSKQLWDSFKDPDYVDQLMGALGQGMKKIMHKAEQNVKRRQTLLRQGPLQLSGIQESLTEEQEDNSPEPKKKSSIDPKKLAAFVAMGNKIAQNTKESQKKQVDVSPEPEKKEELNPRVAAWVAAMNKKIEQNKK